MHKTPWYRIRFNAIDPDAALGLAYSLAKRLTAARAKPGEPSGKGYARSCPQPLPAIA